MPRPKSDKPGATLQIDVDTFVRTRDSVVTGLQTLQDAIRTLSSAYIKHTNAVLGEHGAGLDVDVALAKLGENPLLSFGDGLGHTGSPVFLDHDQKQRKKRTHDPNAPKRPLTPFFLYMQTARPIIGKDLGPDVAKGLISSEGQRRWQTMGPADKRLWTTAYRDNLRLYNARMHSYKAGNLEAKDMTEEEAAEYAELNNIPAPVVNTADSPLAEEETAAVLEHVHIDEVEPDEIEDEDEDDDDDDDDDDDAEGELEKEPTPPPKTPIRRRKSKSHKVTPLKPDAEPEAIVPPSSSSIVRSKSAHASAEKENTPEKKRKRSSKKAIEAALEKAKTVAKPKKKKSKNET